MRPFGYSTGALARGDFGRALKMLDGVEVDAIELSALRVHELPGLLEFSRQVDLSRFSHVSVHAPTDYAGDDEANLVKDLGSFVENGWPIVAHPDVMTDYSAWASLGSLLYIENMDKRKLIGRTVEELERIFEKLPKAQMCFDIGHARQVDTSMLEAYRLAKSFRDRIKQIHISAVSSSSKHDVISPNAAHAFREVSFLIPSTIPAILETPISENHPAAEMREQLEMAKRSLDRTLPEYV